MSGFNATPVDGSSPTPIPMSSAVVPGDKTPKAIKAGPATTDSQGNPLSGVSMYTYDGDNETMGFKADAAITNAASSGTFMAFIKGIVKILADVWDGTNHWLQIKVMNGNANGQATMVNSAPVVIASNQSAVPASQSGTWTVAQGNGGPSWNMAVSSSGNITTPNNYHLVSAASNNASVIKASPGLIYGYDIYNANAAARYVKIYDKATTPTPGTDTPMRVIGVAPNGRAEFHSVVGLGNATGSGAYSHGISIAIVAGIADSDNTSVGANDVVVNIDWI